jgi:uncharacterized protein DUF748
VDTRKLYRCAAWTAGILATYSLLGFFLVPYLVKSNAISIAQEQFAADLRIEKVAFNPYVLSLSVQGVALDDPQKDPFLRVGEIFVNFQSSSLFRLAWTFDEFRLTAPEIFLSRDSGGDLNLMRFESVAPDEVDPDPEDESSVPGLLIFKFLVQQCVVNWNDDFPIDPVAAVFGPVDININELNTLPQRSGQQAVVITTETSGKISWDGSLELAPLTSVGHASVAGSQMPIMSSYLRHEIGFDLIDGSSDIELDYRISTEADGSISVAVENVTASVNNVVVTPFDRDAASDEAAEILRLPEVQLQAGNFFWPQRRVTIGRFAINDAEINLHRFADGSLNALRNSSAESPLAKETEQPEVPPTDAVDTPWDIQLDEFSVSRLNLAFVDDLITPPAEVGVDNVNVSVTGMNNQESSSFPTRFSMQFRHGGEMTASGDVQALPQPNVNFDIDVVGASLTAVQPYVTDNADLHLSSGLLGVRGKIAHNPDEPLSFLGDINVSNFELDESDEGTRLGGWQSLIADGIALSIASNELEISEVRLVRPYGNIHVAADGSVNLGRVDKGDGAEEATEDTEAPADPESESQPMDILVGRVILEDASADFADESLPLPFAAEISNLNGDMTTISTTSSEPSTVEFEGGVDEHGFVRIAGSLTPFDPPSNTDIDVRFTNVLMPKFSSYSVPFAGRQIATGSLDLELGYRVDQGELLGENRIVLREFELGDKVDHPGAMSLPLGLAVALLKDPDGRIDIDLPVRGDVNDPDFSYGGVVWKALGNLIIKIVASPFALLGNLVGAEANELEYLFFLDGRADLTPPEQYKIQKIAEVMALRPELVLEIPGAIDRENDGLALRTAAVNARIATLVEAEMAEDDNAAYADVQSEKIDDTYLEHLKNGEPSEISPKAQMKLIRATFESIDAEGEESFDALAYSNELLRQLIDIEPVAEADLAALARARAENSRDALLLVDEGLSSRVSIGTLNAVERKDNEMIGIKLVLSTGNEAPTAPETVRY